VIVVGVKLGYNEEQISHMTYGKFVSLYEAYKSVFDLENTFRTKGIGYSALKQKDMDEIIPL